MPQTLINKIDVPSNMILLDWAVFLSLVLGINMNFALMYLQGNKSHFIMMYIPTYNFSDLNAVFIEVS